MRPDEEIKALLLQAAEGVIPEGMPVKDLLARMKAVLNTRSAERARDKKIQYMKDWHQRRREQKQMEQQLQAVAATAAVNE